MHKGRRRGERRIVPAYEAAMRRERGADVGGICERYRATHVDRGLINGVGREQVRNLPQHSLENAVSLGYLHQAVSKNFIRMKLCQSLGLVGRSTHAIGSGALCAELLDNIAR
jgi:hypothetical protein